MRTASDIHFCIYQLSAKLYSCRTYCCLACRCLRQDSSTYGKRRSICHIITHGPISASTYAYRWCTTHSYYLVIFSYELTLPYSFPRIYTATFKKYCIICSILISIYLIVPFRHKMSLLEYYSCYRTQYAFTAFFFSLPIRSTGWRSTALSEIFLPLFVP